MERADVMDKSEIPYSQMSMLLFQWCVGPWRWNEIKTNEKAPLIQSSNNTPPVERDNRRLAPESVSALPVRGSSNDPARGEWVIGKYDIDPTRRTLALSRPSALIWIFGKKPPRNVMTTETSTISFSLSRWGRKRELRFSTKPLSQTKGLATLSARQNASAN